MSVYDLITKINTKKFRDKKILIIGSGWMAGQYAIVLYRMGIHDVTIISKTKDHVFKLCDEFGFRPIFGGFQKKLPMIKKMDLVIITPPIEITIQAAKKAIDSGQTNILIEKPGSLYHEEIATLQKKIKRQRVRVAYNRLTYPNYLKLKELVRKDGGITSCRFTITERVKDLVFPKKGHLEIHKRFGLYNSVHVTCMVADLIGLPKTMSNIQYGKLDWHPSGAVFVGSGISKQNIPFSYHADWTSSGRWGIEVMTRKNAYRLISLEELYVCKLHQDNWNKVPFKRAFLEVKQGMAEEIVIMLDSKLEKKIKLVTLKRAIEFSKFTEKIFGY